MQNSGSQSNSHLLSVQGLCTTLFQSRKSALAVNNVSLNLDRGSTLGVVGESGSGKTMLALSLLRILPDPPARTTGGSVLFKERDLLTLSEKEMRKVRGREISMIFQEPMTSLNPVFKIGDQVAEPLRLHFGLNKKESLQKAAQILDEVGIPSADKRLNEFPHNLSGGMRQRVMIAMALACQPELILADEPTTALDVTIQLQILNLLKDLQKKRGTSILLITHDLGVVAETCHNVAVMYAGKIVEYGPAIEIFKKPRHHYTKGLLTSLPRMDLDPDSLLSPVQGMVPDLFNLPGGCSFAPRCPKALPICSTSPPPTFITEPTRVDCWLYDN